MATVTLHAGDLCRRQSGFKINVRILGIPALRRRVWIAMQIVAVAAALLRFAGWCSGIRFKVKTEVGQ